jgi:ribonucleoside-diphosphate reductase subunit M1
MESTTDQKKAERAEELKHLLWLGEMFVRGVNTPPARSAALAPPAAARGGSHVVDRAGNRVPVRFDMITARNEELCSSAYGPELVSIDAPAITAEVVQRFRSGMTTRELDAETMAICVSRSAVHSDYEWLAARICVSDLHKRTTASLAKMVDRILAAAPDRSYVRLSDEFIAIVRRADAEISARLDFRRDYSLRHFGFTTMARGYLLRPGPRSEEPPLLETQLMERPQHLYMRVALGVFVCQPGGDGHLAPEPVFARRLADAFAFYELLSTQRISNATPTLLNTGTPVAQLSSCFQTATGDDLSSLYMTLHNIALISKWSGGVSLWLHNVRSENAPIRGTGGRSSGLKNYVKVLHETQLYVNQGGNRPGAVAAYLSVDHGDILTFLRMGRVKNIEESLRAVSSPRLKYALWVSNLFMRTLSEQIANDARAAAGGENDPTAGDWYLFDPSTAPGLHLVYGAEYEALYRRYVAERRYQHKIKAGEIMVEAFKTWAQTGTPYVLYKDHFNAKSNMINIGPICSSNLCTEIGIPSWSDHDVADFSRFHPGNTRGEYGVCNLAAICLESFLQGGRLDFAALEAAAAVETRALNRVIDLNYYPSPECERSNRRHRPIGIGIMGLADVLARLRLGYDTAEARALARAIAATVYFGAVAESCRLAGEEGAYETFEGSPTSRGELQPDLWVAAGHLGAGWEAELEASTGGYLTPQRWAELRAAARRGVRNAYLTAYMPTATTSNMVGQNECFEPFTSNIYARKTQAGVFTIVNRHLMAELEELGVWDEAMRQSILNAGGSVQGIERIPAAVRRRYLTARELHQSYIIQMATALAPFVCQSLSMNCYLNEPDLPKILRFLFDGWRAGLKTGVYYIHTRPAAGAQKADEVVKAPAAQAPAVTTPAVATPAVATPAVATPAVATPEPAAVTPARAGVVCTDEICTSCAL